MRFFFYFLLAGIVLAQNSARGLAVVTGQDLFAGKKMDVEVGRLGLVVIFMSARCPCSNSHVAKIQKLTTDFPAFQFVVVHANRDESISEARAYFGRQGFSFPVLQDEDLKLADRFHASRTPHAFVLSPSGDIVYRGGVTDSTDGQKARAEPLRAALDDLNHNQIIRVKDARALGCAISRTARSE